MPDAPPTRRETPLAERLKARLMDGERITFADYMREAVTHGYYGRGPDIGGGNESDFYTAVNLPGFAESVARFLAGALDRLSAEGDAPLHVVELGGGTGELAADVTDHLDALGWKGRYRYVLVEPSPALADKQRARTGLTVVGDLSEVGRFTGVAFANEVLDALPVHRVTRLEDGTPAELYLALETGDLAERPGPASTPAVHAAAETLRPGDTGEVSLLYGPLLRALAKAMERGYVLFLDYGDETDVIREARPEGTVRTYEGHRAGNDPFEAPGEQDVTADVDFTRLGAEALDAGFATAGYATQGAFLLDLGIAETYRALAAEDPLVALKTKALFLPGGMGERFKAFALAVNAPPEPPLPGFRGPGFTV